MSTQIDPSKTAPFDPIQFISNYGGFRIMLSAHRSIGMDTHLSEQLLEDELEMLYHAAEASIFHHLWDHKNFLSHYPGTRTIFAEVKARKEHIDLVNTLKRPGAEGYVTVYCPRGCNQIAVCADEPWDQCAACGQLMTSRSESTYMDALVRSGQAM